MTRDDIIRIAQEAGFAYFTPVEHMNRFKKFADLVAAAEREECKHDSFEMMRDAVNVAVKAEREACAQVVDDFGDEWMCDSHELAKIIRARSNND